MYQFLRSNILKIVEIGTSDGFLKVIDDLMNRFILINGFAESNFNRVPMFSIFHVLLYIKLRRQKISLQPSLENGYSLFLDEFEELIKDACLISKASFSTSFERFAARFFWMKWMMISSLDIESFVRNLHSQNSDSFETTFSELFPNA